MIDLAFNSVLEQLQEKRKQEEMLILTGTTQNEVIEKKNFLNEKGIILTMHVVASKFSAVDTLKGKSILVEEKPKILVASHNDVLNTICWNCSTLMTFNNCIADEMPILEQHGIIEFLDYAYKYFLSKGI